MKLLRTTHIILSAIGLFSLLVSMEGLGQCISPSQLGAGSLTMTTATLQWTVNNSPSTGHCWTIEVGAEGFECGEGEQLFETTACTHGANQVDSWDPGSGLVTFTVTGLQPGTSYQYSLVETCFGNPSQQSGSCDQAVSPPFITIDAPFEVTTETTGPVCPEVSPGYVTGGSITVEIQDGETCTETTYDINVEPAPASSPEGNDPPPPIPSSRSGVQAADGPFFFGFAGAGQYIVTVAETGPCNPASATELYTVEVPDGTDSEGPVWMITDLIGNVLVDNDPNTATEDNLDLGEFEVPEGSCSLQQVYFATGYDDCDGYICDPGAVGIGSPFPQASIGNDLYCNYQIDVNWSAGAAALVVEMCDATGNCSNLSLAGAIIDNVDPSVSLNLPGNITIPVCADSRDVIFSVAVDDICDQDLAMDNLEVIFQGQALSGIQTGPGVFEFAVTVDINDNAEVILATYTDAYGNMGSANAALTVVQAATDSDPVIDVPGNLSYSIPSCQSAGALYMSLQVWDDCEQIVESGLLLDAGGSGFDGAVFYSYDPGNNTGYWEFNGDVAPGNYLMTATYTNPVNGQGSTVEFTVAVSQDAARPADIIMPGNLNFTVPVCMDEVSVSFSIAITDDCDMPVNAGNASFEIDCGGVITPLTPTVQTGGYFEFTETLSQDMNGCLLTAAYLDGDGLITELDAILMVTDQPDNWAPLIIYPAQDISEELDPCDQGPAIISFKITAADNCDGDLVPEVQIAPSPADAALIPVPGGSSWMVIAGPGSYQVLIEAVDAAGNLRQEDFSIVITQDAAPVVALGCHDTLNVTLNEDCQALVIPDMVLEGEFGCLSGADFAVTVQDEDPSNGPVVDGCGDYLYEVAVATPAPVEGFTGPFAPGKWSFLIGNNNLLSFSPDQSAVALTGPDPVSCSLCQTSMAISIPADGVLTFDYDWSNLDANFGPFFDAFIALISAAGNLSVLANTGSQVSGTGSISAPVQAGDILMIRVVSDEGMPEPGIVHISNFSFQYDFAGADPGDFSSCWGYIHAEDKTAPEITCPEDKNQATVSRDVQFVEGSLEVGDPVLSLADYSCFLDFFNPSPGPHFYELFTFTVTEADVYTFDLATEWGGGLAALYQGSFDPANPCKNIIAQGDFVFNGSLIDFFPFDPVFRVSLPLIPGNTYVMLTSANGNLGTGLTGGYTWGIYSDGSGMISNLPVSEEILVSDLVCTDITEVLIDSLPAAVPRCYRTDAGGEIIFPVDPQEAALLEQLLNVLSYTGYPYNGPTAMGGALSDNCGDLEICVSDEVQENGDCGETVLSRTFAVSDDKGQMTSCQQQITIRKPTLDDVLNPPFTAILECDESFPTDNNGNPSPEVTGFPFIQTAFGITDLDQAYCTLGASYSDGPAIETCGSGYIILREWTLVDWCNPSASVTYVQVIEVSDFTPPEVICPFVDYNQDGIGDTLVFSTGPFNCAASFQVPLPSVSDNCSSWEITTEILGADSQVLAYFPPEVQNLFTSNIPPGCHRLRYTVVDDCGNQTVEECPLCVKDLIAPVATCDDELIVSIGGLGLARLYATDANEASSDNCEVVNMEVRRLYESNPDCNPVAPYYAEWGEYVDFSCCDINEMITVELRVTDGAGNTGLCWMEVLVEDKIRPQCDAPHAEVIACRDLPYDFDPGNPVLLQALFGVPEATDNCPGATWEELAPIIDLHECGHGLLIRNFRAIDQVGNISAGVCQQTITIEPSHDYEIRFPEDASANCGTPEPDSVELFELGCDLLAVNTDDEQFEASEDECYKILRTYRVINWCEYDGISDPVLISREEDCDGLPGDEEVWVLRRANATFIDRDNEEGNNVPLPGIKGTVCDGATNPAGYWRSSVSTGYWEYTQLIKVYDNISPQIISSAADPFCSLNNTTCEGIVTLSFQVEEVCTEEEITLTIYYDAYSDGIVDADLSGTGALSGTYPDYQISGAFPVGHHQFEVIVEDGCGNATSADLPFEVVDCRAPSLACINGLETVLMPLGPGIDADGDGDIDQGAATLWASSFIASPAADCSGPIRYSINFFDSIPDPGQQELVLTCDRIGTQVVEIYAWDSAYNPYSVQPDGTLGGPNYVHCETFILLEDPGNQACAVPVSGSISGQVATEETEPVENVDVHLSGQMNEAMATGMDGLYGFSDLETGYDYTVTPALDTDHGNGVSTFDIVIISKHIIGVEPLTSPYKMIAADANRSGSISTADLIHIRRLILSIIDEFELNTSWRFVPESYVFPNPDNPWQEEFPEVININNLGSQPYTEQDFVAIKIGDVNGSANVNGLLGIEDRHLENGMYLETEEKALEPGREYRVTFTTADLAQIQGCQFTLNFDRSQLHLEKVEYAEVKEGHIGLRFVEEGAITMSWHHNGEIAASQDVEMFTLVFKAGSRAMLSDLLSIGSRLTRSEAYDGDYHFWAVSLRFTADGEPVPGYKLYQNRPNPFRHTTAIGFDLPEEMNATLTIRDAAGRKIAEIGGKYAAGYNEVLLKDPGVRAGMLYCTLTADEFTATRKMILVE